MRNIEFKERSGPGVKRRIFAFVAIVAGVALGLLYFFFAPRTYCTSLNLLTRNSELSEEIFSGCLNERRENFLKHIKPENEKESEQLAGLIRNITITRVDKGLLRMECKEWTMPGLRLFGERVLGNLYECALMQSRMANEKQAGEIETKRTEDIALIKKQISELGAKYAQSPQAAKALAGLQSAVEGKGWPEGGWQAAFVQDGAEGQVISELENLLSAAQEVTRALTRDQALAASLDKWINSPENATVTSKLKRVVYYEDSPELVRLKDEKAKIEAERMRLLQRATSKHPAAIKMSDEINQLQSQIEALTRLPQVVEDVVEKSNPELVNWKKELADVRAAVTGNMAKLIQLKAQIGTYIPQLAALEKQRLASEMTAQQKTLNQQVAALEALNTDKAAQPEDPFRMFSPAGDAVVSDPPNMLMCILAGLGAGLICAYFLLLSRVKTNFKVLEKPEVVKPVYPVIGRISRLNDGEECA